MQTVDEKQETIHVYVIREQEPKPPVLAIALSSIALSLLLILCVFSPYEQPEVRAVIRVPAVFLPVQSFVTTAVIIPTGIKTYPAINAQGILTITNGSVIASELPQGLIFTSRNGIEIRTDSSVFVPAGNASGYGFATVSAHTLIGGKSGNILAYAINQVEGTSIYIRNLQSFTDGKDAYSVKFVTPQDRQTAVDHAWSVLNQSVQSKGILDYPCKENHFRDALKMVVTWQCQFVTYSVPPYMKVARVRIAGKNLLLDVVYRPLYRREGQK